MAGLADRAGLSDSHLRDVLTCAPGTTVGWLTRVANALEVAPAEFVEGRGRAAGRRRAARGPGSRG